MSTRNMRVEKSFVIANGQTQLAAGSPLDTAELSLVGIRCVEIGTATTMTFDGSGGSLTDDANENAEPTPPSAAADYGDLLESDGTTEQLTLTLSEGDYLILKPEEAGKTMNWPRFLRPTLNQDPGEDATFIAVLRMI